MGRKKVIPIKIPETERDRIIQQWLKNKLDAMARGNWKEVERINKILMMYGYKPSKKELEAEMEA